MAVARWMKLYTLSSILICHGTFVVAYYKRLNEGPHMMIKVSKDSLVTAPKPTRVNVFRSLLCFCFTFLFIFILSVPPWFPFLYNVLQLIEMILLRNAQYFSNPVNNYLDLREHLCLI
jgi:hypothetical protein